MPPTSPKTTATSEAGPSPSWRERLAAYRLLHGLALVVFVFDQITKLWAAKFSGFPLNFYPPWGGHEVIPGFFNLVYVRNPGAAWGVLAGHVELLAVFALFALGGIFFFRHTLGLRSRFMQVSFGLLVGGIAGNLLDRLLFGYVVDFIDVVLPWGYRWPTFNIADSAIVIGCGLYLWASFQEPHPAPAGDAAP